MADETTINLSDEAIANANSPEELLGKSKEEDKPSEETKDTTEESSKEDTTVEEQSSETIDEGNTNSSGSETKEPEDNKTKEPESSSTTEPEEKIDYEGFYKTIMKPFKANGKEIQIRNVNEAIQLMQQGANYTRKMQALAPHRKLLIMLENNGLLDESKLNYLIDLDKKNPDAIRKLVKDSGIDSLDLALNEDNKTEYQPKNYGVSDQDATFIETLNELKADPEGFKTLQEIHSRWDTESINMLAKYPQIMNDINMHRQLGIYDKVVAEVERQKVLGNISSNTPFLQAYKAVGDIMNEAANKRKPIARGTAPKTVSNNARVNAAAPTKSTGRKASNVFNPLSLSDEDFEKQFELFRNRV